MERKMFEHLINEFEQECNDLFESMDFQHRETELFQHRGKPDPKLERQRQEAHKRGIERHKNALKRQRQQQTNRRKSGNKIETKVETKPEERRAETRKAQIKQKLNDIKTAKVQKGKQLAVVPKDKEAAKKEVGRLSTSLNKEKKFIDNKLHKMINSAPSEESKQVAVAFKKDLEKLSKQDSKKISAWSKLSPAARKARKERELEDLKTKHKGNLKDSDRAWFRKTADEICTHTVTAADNFFDLCGIKDIYDDVWKATNYVTGGGASKIVSKTKQTLFGK